MIRAAEEEKDVGQKLNPAAEDNLEERGGKRGGPRKMFRWTDEIRSDVEFLSCVWENLTLVMGANLQGVSESGVKGQAGEEQTGGGQPGAGGLPEDPVGQRGQTAVAQRMDAVEVNGCKFTRWAVRSRLTRSVCSEF